VGEVAVIRAGGSVSAILPQSFEEAWRIAGALAASGMTPKDINTQEKVLAVIMAGAEIGMAPFQALQSFAVINGRPALWGDGMLATVRKFGVKVDERFVDGVAVCTVTRSDTSEQITRTFSEADAVRAGLWKKAGPWTTYPQRMLQMRARAWALRDGCADMLRGMKMAEEAQDVEVVENEPIEEPTINASQAKKANLWPELEAEIRAFTDLHELEAFWAAAETKARVLALPRKWQDPAENEYLCAQEKLAEKAQQEIDEARGQ
jgi:hypothetical protein